MRPNEMRRHRAALALVGAAVLSTGCAPGTMRTESGGEMAMPGGTRPAASVVLGAWPMKQRETAMEFKQGSRSSPYVTGLMFRSGANAADPDKPHMM
jgi:hypothetical protein